MLRSIFLFSMAAMQTTLYVRNRTTQVAQLDAMLKNREGCLHEIQED